MPGKVNPSILEAAQMVCYRVIGAETAISYGLHAGQLNLNVMMPLMSFEAITATQLSTNICKMLEEKCISGIQANRDICESYALESDGLLTALNPLLGYATVAELVKEKAKTGKNIHELLVGSGKLTQEQFDTLLLPQNLTNPK